VLYYPVENPGSGYDVCTEYGQDRNDQVLAVYVRFLP
jgi:hypothetical protein